MATRSPWTAPTTSRFRSMARRPPNQSRPDPTAGPPPARNSSCRSPRVRLPDDDFTSYWNPPDWNTFDPQRDSIRAVRSARVTDRTVAKTNPKPIRAETNRLPERTKRRIRCLQYPCRHGRRCGSRCSSARLERCRSTERRLTLRASAVATRVRQWETVVTGRRYPGDRRNRQSRERARGRPRAIPDARA